MLLCFFKIQLCIKRTTFKKLLHYIHLVSFPDAEQLQDTEVLAARMGDGDAASDSDASGDFQVRRKAPVKEKTAKKVPSSDSDSDGSGIFEVRAKKRSKKSAHVLEPMPDAAEVRALDEKLDGDELPEFFDSPPVNEKDFEGLVDGADMCRIDLPEDVAEAFGIDTDKFVAYVQVE
jgi:hypothetical protein